MRREMSTLPEVKVERPLLVWEPVNGAPVEYEVWPERPLTIGRDGVNAVVLDSPFVSKAHAVIRYSGGDYTVEDLKSANGTRVNGAPVLVSVLVPGDIVEVGDQRLIFREGKAAAGGGGRGLSKNAKLMLTAVGTLGVFGIVFALVASSGSPPAPRSPSGSAAASKMATPAAVPPVDTNSSVVREALDRAQQAGVKPVDALFDEANAMLAAGRLREAAQLFGAAVERDPRNESAGLRFADAKTAWARAIGDHAAEAERASDELRLNDAILEWGQVLLLIDANDPRHQLAEQGIDRARRRLAH